MPLRRLTAAAATLVLAAAGVAAEERLPIIDMHQHARVKVLRGPDGQPMPRPCEPRPCESTPARYTTDESIRLGTLAEMERHGVVLGFLSDHVESVYQWVAAAPGRFIPSVAWMDEVGPDLESLRAAYRSGRLKGMGEIATQYATMAPNDPRLEPYYALAEELDLPVLIHTAGLGAPTPGFRASLGRPLQLEEVVVRHPRLRLYLENAGYPFLEEAIALMVQHPQVHADVSTITWLIPRQAFYRHLQGLMDAGLGKRVMFGSDQMEWPEVIGLGVEAIESAPFLTPAQRRDILYHNAVRFLRLPPGESQVR